MLNKKLTCCIFQNEILRSYFFVKRSPKFNARSTANWDTK